MKMNELMKAVEELALVRLAWVLRGVAPPAELLNERIDKLVKAVINQPYPESLKKEHKDLLAERERYLERGEDLPEDLKLAIALADYWKELDKL